YQHRKSLIRLIQSPIHFRILKPINTDIKPFQLNQHHEVLYQLPILSRYFIPSYPKHLFHFHSIQQLIQYRKPPSSNHQTPHPLYTQFFLS
ncbi:DUF2398 family protein, partial [Siminovitchia fortis]|uniref:DUF2398 family protein n=1 Tax=Siminovitchia fortis TaxID=254758 RepID=UPI0011A7A802